MLSVLTFVEAAFKKPESIVVILPHNISVKKSIKIGGIRLRIDERSFWGQFKKEKEERGKNERYMGSFVVDTCVRQCVLRRTLSSWLDLCASSMKQARSIICRKAALAS